MILEVCTTKAVASQAGFGLSIDEAAISKNQKERSEMHDKSGLMLNSGRPNWSKTVHRVGAYELIYGGIYYWATNKAIGHTCKMKYHIFVCPADGWDDHTFLLINTYPYGNDLKCTKRDFPFLEYDSYIGCNIGVTYTDTELVCLDKRPIGHLSKGHMQSLSSILAVPGVMELMRAKRITNALMAAFSCPLGSS